MARWPTRAALPTARRVTGTTRASTVGRRHEHLEDGDLAVGPGVEHDLRERGDAVGVDPVHDDHGSDDGAGLHLDGDRGGEGGVERDEGVGRPRARGPARRTADLHPVAGPTQLDGAREAAADGDQPVRTGAGGQVEDEGGRGRAVARRELDRRRAEAPEVEVVDAAVAPHLLLHRGQRRRRERLGRGAVDGVLGREGRHGGHGPSSLPRGPVDASAIDGGGRAASSGWSSDRPDGGRLRRRRGCSGRRR